MKTAPIRKVGTLLLTLTVAALSIAHAAGSADYGESKLTKLSKGTVTINRGPTDYGE